MSVIRVEKISFAMRLKQLMKERQPPMTQAELAGKLRNPAYEDCPPFNPHTISRWMNGGSLRRHRKEIIQQLADIFDVDPEYLECTQIEKRREPFDFEKWNVELNMEKFPEYMRKRSGVEAYLKSIGVEIDFDYTEGIEEEFENLLDGYIYVTVEKVGTKGEYILTLDDKTVTFSEDEFSRKLEELEKYVKFFLFN